MTDQIRSSAGSCMAITTSASIPSSFDQAGYEALTYQIIANIEQIPQFGANRNLVTFNPLKDIDVVKIKGSRDNGSMDVSLALVEDSVSIPILEAAEDSEESFSFYVETQSKTKRYFVGKVMSLQITVGGVDDVTMANFTVELEKKPFKVLPTP